MRARQNGAKSIRFGRSSCACLAFLAALLSGCNLFSGNLNNRFGISEYERGNYIAARDGFSRAVADEPQSPAFTYNLACALQRLGDSGSAVQTYWRAIRLDPTHEPSYHALARLLVEEGHRDEATELISTWVEGQPHNAGAQLEMAWIERENGDLNAAEQSLFRSLAARPNNPIATGQLGQLYEQLGQNERAAVMYRRSLQADWFQPQLRARLALLESGNRAVSTPTSPYALNSTTPFGAANLPSVASVNPAQSTSGPARLAGSAINDDPAHLVD